MTKKNPEYEEEHKRVVDEEGSVDEKIKNRIIKARERVSDREDLVFVKARLQGVQYTEAELVEIWKTPVKQYLERIEPLLQSDEIEESDLYYKEIEIADRPVYPPDGETAVVHEGETKAEKIQWSLLQSDQLSKREIVTTSNSFGRGVEAPEPKRFKVTGLKDVIEKATQTFTWEVVLNPEQVGPARKIARPSVREGLTKDELKKAVRLADIYLHEHVGIGVELGSGDPHDMT